jgi:hypothetical protein
MHHRVTLLEIERLQGDCRIHQGYLHLSGAATEARKYIEMREHNRRRLC